MNTKGIGHGRAVTIPVATINRVVEELLEKGHIARPYLGVAMHAVEVPDNLRSKLPAHTRAGLLVLHVESGGPAEKAGVSLGDLVFEASGKTLEHLDAVQDLLRAAKVGEVVEVRVVRGGEVKLVSLTLGDRAR